jgi:glycosyltransferase involved in cell wall biosynthesis
VKIKISAVVCTLNRAPYLRKAIRSLIDQTLPSEDYEIIVVDNGSTDGTAEMVRDEFPYVSNLTYVREPVLGLSQARNTGWRSAKGDYVAYLDDDAVASPKWLEMILRVFATVKPAPGCVGGRIEPIWEAPRPPWLPDALLPYLTVIEWSKTPITLSTQQWVAGTNIAIPKLLLERVGGFQSALGRRGKKLLSNDEILIQIQLQNIGYQCYYHPDIAVRHHVPASRLTKRWFYNRVFWQGVSNGLIRSYQKPGSVSVRLDMGLRSIAGLMLTLVKLASLAPFTNEADRFALKCAVITEAGCISGLLGLVK